MLDPITLGLLGAGAGLLKSEIVDKPREQRDRDIAMITTRYSPWTGLRSGAVREADPFGNALQYGATGAMIGAGLESQAKQDALAQAMTDRLNTGGSLGGGFGGGYGLNLYKLQGPAAMQAAGEDWPGGPLNYPTWSNLFQD